MSIVLNEYEWVEDILKNPSLGGKPTETLGRVARYYISKGHSKKETRQLVESFLVQCDSNISVTKWSNVIEYVIGKAAKYGVIEIDSVNVTDKEMATIDALGGRQVKRLAFTLLCLAKYWDAVNPKCDHWVVNKDVEIMKLANINASIKRQSAMYAELNKKGLIQFSKKIDNTNVRVCFMEPGETVISLCDFRDLGYQYLMYHGEPYYICESCGVISKKPGNTRGRKSIHCAECASEIKTRQSIASVMRSRNKK